MSKKENKKKKTARGVRFASEDDVHLFDTKDAPGANIFDVIAADSTTEQRRNSNVEITLGNGSAPPTPQKIDGEVRTEFDTDLMTVAELKEALQSRGLSTRGKKSELKNRLEEDIMRENPTSLTTSTNKAKRIQDENEDWLQW